MESVLIDDVEPSSLENGVDRRGLSDLLGTTDVAINHYRIAPGEGFPGGLHAHTDQEEVFIVIEGEATYETMDGEVVVREGEPTFVCPDCSAERIPQRCPECGCDEMRVILSEENTVVACPECGVELEKPPFDT